MTPTVLDFGLLAVMLVSGVLAMVRGFMREILSIASWVIAAIVTLYGYSRVLPYVKQYVQQDLLATGIAVGGLFLLTLLIVSLFTVKISDLVLDSRIGALDRTLGFVFGAARGMLLVVVGLAFFNWFVPAERQPQWVVQAKSRDLLTSIGLQLQAALPEDPEKTIQEFNRSSRRNADEPQGQAQGQAQGGNENTGYSAAERQGIDQLTTSGTGN